MSTVHVSWTDFGPATSDCRLAIRSFVEKARSEGVDDSCDEFTNLATILEHILSHRLKGK